MLNLVPLAELMGATIPKTIECAICHEILPNESAKVSHMESAHPNWALTIMSVYLRQIPRENG